MYAKKFAETQKYYYKGKGNLFYMLLPRDITEAMESSLVVLKKGEEVGEHKHDTEEQIYIVMKGKGLFRMKGEEAKIGPEMVVFIPRGTPHQVLALTKELVYVYVAVWPKGIPADNKDWKKAMQISE